MSIPVLVSVKHRMLGVPTDQAVTNLFPDAKQLNGHTVVKHGLQETFMLRKFGYDVPAPIMSYYDWPHPLNEPPFDAQLKTASHLTMNSRAYVLNSMGTGKTRSALWAWDFLNKEGYASKLLVVAPLSTLKFTWAREIFATLPKRKYAVLHGTKAQRLEALKEDVDIYIINHDGIKTVEEALLRRRDINAIVLDELAVYRNGQSQRSKNMRKMAQNYTWVWGMTGSPIPNEPTDAWAQASIVTPRSVPKYFRHFREDVMYRVSQFTWLPKPDATDKAFRVLQPAVRFTLDDVVELPEAIYRTVDIELGKTQAKVYKQMAAHCFAAVQSNDISAANAGACMQKLLQISCGYVYIDDDGTGARRHATLDNDARVAALLDMLQSGEGKKLVFTSFKHALTGIAKTLENEGIDYASMSGDTPANRRAEIFNLFQNTNKFSVLAAHPQCLAHGITLTAADTVIWFNPTLSLEIYEQANARISRVGQKRKQLFEHFQGTAVEKRVYQLLRNKQNIQRELLGLFEVATQSM